MIDSSTMAETVRSAVSYCLFRDGEPTTPHVVGEGVINSFGFHPERLEEKRPVVIELIDRLDPEFRKNGGGGASFLQLCTDKDGVQWGEHRECSDLIAIANALKLAKFLAPRGLWSALPGGMPYVIFE